MDLCDRPTVAVVGAGFSGLLTALRLVQQPDGPRVRLFERSASFARGAAYAPSSAELMLNVRAGNMSAYAEQPDHFLEWLERDGGAETRSVFVTRSRYGDYLQSLLRDAASTGEPGRLLLEADTVADIRRRDGRLELTLGMGRRVGVDSAVLAIGNLPPHRLPGLSPGMVDSGHYVGDPWALKVGDLPETGLVVLLGTGLTMVDVALQIAAARPRVRMVALSRRGLLPRRHLEAGPAALAFSPRAPQTVRGVLRELRRRSAETEWRAVVDGLRPHVQAIWRRWPLEERRRFLRHARPWWDVHRHRLAPPVAARIDELTGTGALRIERGRIVGAEAGPQGVTLEWSSGGGGSTTVDAQRVVNCTGPTGDLAAARDPLVESLMRQGLIRADACRLGLDVDVRCSLISQHGQAQADLFAVGPITRGAFWEITSVPDIRVQAGLCAQAVAESRQLA